MSGHTPGPWKLILHGNEVYPFPLTVLTADEKAWVARDGVVSSLANARLIAAAPETSAELERAREDIAELVEVVRDCEHAMSMHNDMGKRNCSWDFGPVHGGALGKARAALAKHACAEQIYCGACGAHVPATDVDGACGRPPGCAYVETFHGD